MDLIAAMIVIAILIFINRKPGKSRAGEDDIEL